VCDRLAIIHKGRVQFSGSIAEFRQSAGEDLEEAFLRVLERAA
jgi:ABC-type Na+ transport system ATPase subunit NatA